MHHLRAANAKYFTETEREADQVGRRDAAGDKRIRVQEAKVVFHQAACARRRAVTGRGSSALLVKTNVPSPGSCPGASAADTGAAADLSIADGCGGKSTYRPQDVNLRPRAGTSATAIRGRMDSSPEIRRDSDST